MKGLLFMRRPVSVIFWSMIVLLLPRVSFADDLSACFDRCNKAFAECNARIDTPNDLDKQDMETACTKATVACNDSCEDSEATRQQQLQQQKDAEK
jgi:hypothetical protein